MNTVSQVIRATIDSVKAECWIGEPSELMVERHAKRHAGKTFADMLPFIVESAARDIKHQARVAFVNAMRDVPGTTYPINLAARRKGAPTQTTTPVAESK